MTPTTTAMTGSIRAERCPGMATSAATDHARRSLIAEIPASLLSLRGKAAAAARAARSLLEAECIGPYRTW
jgi:hypothetical protein